MKDNDFLKEVCGELAEKALAARFGVSQDELFDEDGSFYPQYQDTFNALYDYAEEQMTDFEKSSSSDTNSLLKRSNIYTTGAFLAPLKVRDRDGAVVWIWTVSEFEDDTYLDGKTCNPVESAETCDKLLLPDDDEQ
jgi:hypothetical protein